MPKELPAPVKNTDHGMQPEDPPPLLGTWRRLYLAVVMWLVFLIAIFYVFARRFAP